jgi:DNA-binding winged helix-turn-helix (wHTH) protein/Tol biopolymer transport system component
VKNASLLPHTFRFGVFELNPSAKELRKQGMRIRLQGQPVEILIMLMERPGELITREELQKKLWSADTFVDFEQGLNNAMKRLRAALDDNAETPRFIETLPRRGYRFIGTLNGSGPAPAAQAKPATSHKTSWLRFSALAGSAVILALALGWMVRTAPPPPKITSTVQLTSDGREKTGLIATDGLRVYFSEQFDGHDRIAAVPVSGGQPVPIRTPFSDAQLLNISPDRSELLVGEGKFWAEKPLWVVPILGGHPHRLGNVIGHDGSWSPNGKKLVYAHGSALYLTKPDGTEPRELVPAGSNPSVWAWRPTWSQDGNRLRFELDDMAKYVTALWEISADGNNMHPALPGWQDPPMQCCSSWTTDGRYYLFGSWKDLVGDCGCRHRPAPDIWAVREKVGWLRKPSRTPVQLTAGPLHFRNPIPSLDGKVLFATSSPNRGELMHYDRKTQRLSPYLGGISAQSVSFSKDGTWMAYVTFPQGELWRSRTDGGEPLQLTFLPLIVHDPHWSPDGKQIAYSGLKPGGEWELYLVARDGGASQRLLPDSLGGIDSTWSPDGNSLLFGQPPSPKHTGVLYILRIMDVHTRRVSAVPGSNGLRSPRFSPDGKYISATSAKGNKLMLFDVAAQKWTEQGPKDAGFQCWSRNSKYVYFLGRGAEAGIFRVAVNNNQVEKILSLRDFRSAGTFGAWFSLTPDDDPLVLRDIGPPEIYALSWETP